MKRFIHLSIFTLLTLSANFCLATYLDCPEQLNLDCSQNTDPEFTGEPNINYSGESTLSYLDVIIGEDCDFEIQRHWTLCIEDGCVEECVQFIYVSDTTPPVILNQQTTNFDCTFQNENLFTVTDNCDPNPIIEVSVLDSTWNSSEDCETGQLRTQTMGGWGTTPSGNNPGVYLHANFDSAFPDGLTIGCNNTLTLTTAQSITDILPSGSTPSALPEGDLVNPGDAYDNVLAGQLIAATISTTFDGYDSSFGESDFALENLYIQSGEYAGYQVSDLLVLANQIIGGCGSEEFSSINQALSSINENYVDGDQDNGFLACSLPWDCYLEYSIEVTATDQCGNSTTEIITSFFIDDDAPELPFLEEFITVECDEIPEAITDFNDDCFDEYVTFEVSESEFSGTCLPTIHRTYTLSDQCGNASSFTQYIVVVDTQAPVFLTSVEDAVIACGEDLPIVNPEANDNCGDYDISYSEEEINEACTLIVVRTWTATDACGNSDQLIQNIAIMDDVAPYPVNEIVDLEVDCNSIPASDMDFIDDCSTEVLVTFEETQMGSECSYTLQRTWNVTDACNNLATYTQNINVVDSEAPTFTFIPQNIAIDCSEIIPEEQATAADNCGDSTIEFTESVSDDIGCFTITRTWVATDNCGNSNAVSQVISIEDEVSPELINIPENIALSCSDMIPDASVSATDNCDNFPIVEMIENEEVSDCGLIITRIWTATDACGNSSLATQIIEITDQEAPIINGSEEITTDCQGAYDLDWVEVIDDCADYIDLTYQDETIGEGCTYDINRVWIAIDLCGNQTEFNQVIHVIDESAPEFISVPQDLFLACGTFPFLEDPTVEDNCGEFTIAMEELWTGEDCDSQLIRTWIATDACGNIAEAQQTITFTDTESPVISGQPEDLNLICSESIPEAELLTASDNCMEEIEVVFTEEYILGDCPNNYEILRTWSASDLCGNTTQVMQSIVFTDDQAPVFNEVLEDLEVNCGDFPEPPTVTAYDNCDGDVSIAFVEDNFAGGCPIVTRIWTATDGCGNSSQLIQTLYVLDDEAPILNGIPEDATVDCNSIPEVPEPEATDNCDDEVSVVVNESIVGSGCEFTIVRTWIATDDCGNSTIASQSIIVVDDTAPVFLDELAEITLDCFDPEALEFPSVIDDCGGSVFIEFNDEIIGDGCSYDVIRTYTASDLCGNQSTSVLIIHVIDASGPEFLNFQEVIFANCMEVPDPMELEIIDNCFGETTTEYAEEIIGEGCNYLIQRTWIVTDACGNSSMVLQTVIVGDEEAPVFSNIPADLVLDCSDVLPESTSPEATDNCESALEINFISFSESTSCGEVITNHWTAIDACGNSSTVSQTITISDLMAPAIDSVPTDIEVNCNEIPEAAVLGASDNCDPNAVVVFEEEISSGCPYFITRTWTAIDACGNTSSSVQIISVNDTEGPVFEYLPQNMTVSCGNLPEMEILIANDDCSSLVEIVMEETSVDIDCNIVWIRTWTATDLCGNSTTHQQSIEVIDDQAPVFLEMPEDLVLECNEVPEMAPVLAEDVCSDFTLNMWEETIETDCANEYTLIRNWTATDACGNSESIAQIINVIDTTAPTFIETEEEIYVSCSEIPEGGYDIVFDNCDGAIDLVLEEEIIYLGEESADCDLVNSDAWYGDVAIWLPGLSEFGSNYVFGSEGASIVEDEENGTAHVTGVVYNSGNANQSFIIDFYLYDRLNWIDWSTSGGWYKDDFGYAEDNYLDWNYYKLDPSSVLIGSGDFEGDVLSLVHAPLDYTFGFQIGQSANNVNDAFGMSGWFVYDGIVEGVEVSGLGDLIVEIECCPEQDITRTWTATDCAGNSSTFTQIIHVSNSIEFAPLNFPDLDVEFDVYNSEGDEFTISYRTETTEPIRIDLVGINGDIIDVIYEGMARENERIVFTYPKSGLAPSNYMFRLITSKAIATDQEVVIRR